MLSKREINFYLFAGFVFTSVFGTILHFLFEWSGENLIIAAFSATNESTFEHLKIFFFPTFLFGMFEYFKYGKEVGCFWQIKLESILLGLISITTIFYTYKGVLGYSVDYINIAIFFIAAAICYLWQGYRLKKGNDDCREWIWFSGALTLCILFILFTYFPPKIGLFQDPLTGGYGIPS